MPNNILRNQRISAEKSALAKQLRSRMTPAENRLWQALRRSHLQGFHFRRQQIIDGFIVDFYCHAAGLVIELDGPIHAFQQEYDAERDRILKQHNLIILRLYNEDITENLDACLTQIADICQIQINQPKNS